MINNSNNSRYLAAAFVAAAACEILPDLQLISSGVDRLGFYYDISFGYELEDPILSEIERKAAYLLQHAGISSKEMLAQNAKKYLEHLGQLQRVFEKDSYLVTLIQIDNFSDYIPYFDDSLVKKKGSLIVKLYKMSLIQKGVYRIYGFAFAGKKESKNFLKKYDEYKHNHHLAIAKRRKWFEKVSSSQIIWHPKGCLLRENLLSFLKNHLRTSHFKQVDAHPQPIDIFLDATYKFPQRFFEIIREKKDTSQQDLLDASCQTYSHEVIFCKKNQFYEEYISSLQSIMKMLNILGFRYGFALALGESAEENSLVKKALQFLKINFTTCEGKQKFCKINIYALDGLGRNWCISSFRFEENKIISNRCVSLQRWIALLVESEDLPFWILSEQVRLLPIKEKYISFANVVKEQLKNKGIKVEIDLSLKTLNQKVFDAETEDVPYIAVIGEKEEKTNSLALRAKNKKKPLRLAIGQFIEQLNQKEYFENQ